MHRKLTNPKFKMVCSTVHHNTYQDWFAATPRCDVAPWIAGAEMQSDGRKSCNRRRCRLVKEFLDWQRCFRA